MVQVILAIASTLFKASGSFWALRLAHECVLLAQNDGWHLFFYVPAVLLIVIAIVVLAESGTEFNMIIDLLQGEEEK